MQNDPNRRQFMTGAAGAAALVGTLSSGARSEEKSAETSPKTILAIGAHIDDCEIGAGGLIAKALGKGHRVVMVTMVSDFSTSGCQPVRSRPEEVSRLVLDEAAKMGVEKRFMGYGYQQVPRTLEAIKKLARIVIDVRPDITVFHNPYEPSPSDHATVGYIAERAVRDATRVLGTFVPFRQEMYAYEIYPTISQFKPNIFVDISDVIGQVVERVNFFDEQIYGEARPRAKIWIDKSGEQPIPLWTHGDMKLVTAGFRGWQSHARYAEAYTALNQYPVGKRLLHQIVR